MPPTKEEVQNMILEEASGLAPTILDASSSLLEVGIDSLSAVTLAKKLASRFEVAVSVRDLFQYPTVDKLAGHLLAGISAEPLESASAEMQLLQNMAPLVGLRAAVLIQVFWWHFHSGFPAKYWAAFGRCIDMEVLFLVMGLTSSIQHRSTSFGSAQKIGWWIWSQWWKIFPMYWLCIVVVISAQYWAIYDTTLFSQDHSRAFEFTHTLVGVLGLQTLTTNMDIQFWLGIFWFVGTMWIIQVCFPILHTISKYVAPLNNRLATCVSWLFVTSVYYWLWLGCNGDNGAFEHDKRNRIFLQATPYVKVWMFLAGMAVGRLAVSAAIVQDTTSSSEQSWFDRISPRAWGIISDISGMILGLLTFGPPYESRDWPHGPGQYGYFTGVEKHLILPLQLTVLPIFVYALIHNRGMIATVFNFEPCKEFGKTVFPFYLLHFPITLFTLSNGEESMSLVYNSQEWTRLNFDRSFRQIYKYNGAEEFDVDHENGGSVYALGGLALTFVAAYWVQDYYQIAVMDYVEPLCAKLCTPFGKCVQPCFDSILGWFQGLCDGSNDEDEAEVAMIRPDSNKYGATATEEAHQKQVKVDTGATIQHTGHHYKEI